MQNDDESTFEQNKHSNLSFPTNHDCSPGKILLQLSNPNISSGIRQTLSTALWHILNCVPDSASYLNAEANSPYAQMMSSALGVARALNHANNPEEN